MEKRFTKGNWSQTSSNHVKCDFNTIAYAYSMNVGDEQAKANAKLIASAPELLEALIALVNGCLSDSESDKVVSLRKAKQIIIKATE